MEQGWPADCTRERLYVGCNNNFQVSQKNKAPNNRQSFALIKKPYKRKAMVLPAPPFELKLFFPVNTDEENYKNPIDPHEVIYDFFTTYDLKGFRENFWELLKMALENKNITGEQYQIGNFIYLYEKLNDLITANFILNERNIQPEPEQQEKNTDPGYN